MKLRWLQRLFLRRKVRQSCRPTLLYVVCDRATRGADAIEVNGESVVMLHRAANCTLIADHLASAADDGRPVEVCPALIITSKSRAQLEELADVLNGEST